MILRSPLEQFKLKLIYRIYNNYIDISITNSSIILFISIIFLILSTRLDKKIILYKFNSSSVGNININKVKGWGEIIIEKIYKILEEMLETPQEGNKKKKYIPILYTLFLFILINNILGLIPYSFTTTSHIIINITMSLSIIIGITIIGFKKHSFKFFKLFIPSGLSNGPTKYIIPLIFLIEFISYLSRIISLSVRLTANMLSGHILLNLISSYSFKLIFLFPLFSTIELNNLFVILSYTNLFLIPILILIPFILLELGIAFIQSYVFTVLTSAYIKDIVQLH